MKNEIIKQSIGLIFGICIVLAMLSLFSNNIYSLTNATIESYYKIVPDYRIEFENNKIDTIYIYRKSQ